MRRTRVGLVCLVLALISMPTPAVSAPVSERLDMRAFNSRYLELFSDGASRAEIERVLATEFSVRFAPLVRSDGAKVPLHEPPKRPLSDDVYLADPSLVYPEVGDEWFIVAAFRWHHDCDAHGYHEVACWLKDDRNLGAGTSPRRDHGGPDGFGFWTNRGMSVRESYFELKDNCGRGSRPKNDHPKNSSSAVGFITQDTAEYHEPGKRDDYCKPANQIVYNAYNWDSGSLMTRFVWERPCGDLRVISIRPSFAHTWEKTRVTGFDVGRDGIGFDWQPEEHGWEAGRGELSRDYPCMG